MAHGVFTAVDRQFHRTSLPTINRTKVLKRYGTSGGLSAIAELLVYRDLPVTENVTRTYSMTCTTYAVAGRRHRWPAWCLVQ